MYRTSGVRWRVDKRFIAKVAFFVFSKNTDRKNAVESF